MKLINKKMLALLCATALVVTGLVGYNTVTGDETPATEQDPKTHAAGSQDLMAAQYLAGEVGANQYKAVLGSGAIYFFVNIQQPGNATEPGIYVVFNDADFGEMTVNGVPLTCFKDGSGLVLYLTNFEYMYSDVVIKKSDGSAKAVLYIYNKNGIDNSADVIEPETYTGDEPAEIEMNKLPSIASASKVGNYNIGFLNNIDFYAGVDPYNPNHIKVQNATGPNGSQMAAIIMRSFGGLDAGKQYVISIDITPSVANGSYRFQNTDYIPLKEGTNTVSLITYAYGEGEGNASASLNFYANQLGSDVVLDITNPQVREASEEDLTTTAAPTTTARPTTVRPTTTVAPTTVSPTTKTPVTPTDITTKKGGEVVTPEIITKQISPSNNSNVKVSSTNVKKATKKKSAKKIKVVLKKTSGVSKYQIQVSKAKKFSKKNVLITKYSKKTKFNLKSKKFKNKKKLFVRARATKTVAGKIYRSKWSKPKKVKIK